MMQNKNLWGEYGYFMELDEYRTENALFAPT